MKIYLYNTINGLIPVSDIDYEEKKHLKIGCIYSAEIKLTRNYMFLKKYFALINCAWEYLNENQQKFYKNKIDNFRKSMEISAGVCDTIYIHKLQSWVDVPKSISFSKMDNLQFQEVYNNVRNVIFEVISENVSIEEFERNLINF